MATAKTKEAPEAKAEETEEETVSIDDEAFVAKVTAIVKDFLGSKDAPAETDATTETEGETKRLSPRDEEERTRSLVAEAISEFKKSSKGEDKEEKKVESEKVPASDTFRKIEKWLWGKE